MASLKKKNMYVCQLFTQGLQEVKSRPMKQTYPIAYM